MTKVFIGIVFCVVTVMSHSVDAGSWEYIDLSDTGSSFVLIDDPAKFVVVDVARPANTCEKTAGVICFESEEFSFHLPIDFYEVDPSSWAYREFSYESVLDPYLEILGRSRSSLRVITRNQKNEKIVHRYIISMSEGLIAYVYKSESNAVLFVSKKRCGYTAPHGCKASKLSKDSH